MKILESQTLGNQEHNPKEFYPKEFFKNYVQKVGITLLGFFFVIFWPKKQKKQLVTAKLVVPGSLHFFF